MTNQKPPLTHLLKELIQIGIALTSERDLGVLLECIVAEARRFAVLQNEVLEARLGRAKMRARLQADVLPLDTRSLAGYVATTAPAPCSSSRCRRCRET